MTNRVDSVSVAWFTASRVFQTQVGNFSVVEVDGNLECVMAAGDGTVAADDAKSVSVRDTKALTVAGTYTEGLESKMPETPATDQLYLVTTADLGTYTANTMYKYNGSSWATTTLTEESYYFNNTDGTYHIATSTSELSATGLNTAVLTHGSVVHTGTNEGHASVIDGDDTTKYKDKLEAGSENWRQADNVAVTDSLGNSQRVDVYNAVSWTMTFTYTFASDTSPVAIYLDLGKSTLTDPEISPNFKKAATVATGEQTEKGFRIAFFGGDTTDSKVHDLVWGKNTPLTSSIPAAYDSGSSYAVDDRVTYENRIYTCAEGTTGTWDKSKWTLTNDVALYPEYTKKTYSAGDIVVYGNKTYKCNAAIAAAEDWTPGHWSAITDTASLSYVSDFGDDSEISNYSTSDYVWSVNSASYTRVDNLAVNEHVTFDPAGKAERVCVLKKGATNTTSVTINCAAWFEGTDPNIISGARMDCLTANMVFYCRTVNADA